MDKVELVRYTYDGLKADETSYVPILTDPDPRFLSWITGLKSVVDLMFVSLIKASMCGLLKRVSSNASALATSRLPSYW